MSDDQLMFNCFPIVSTDEPHEQKPKTCVSKRGFAFVRGNTSLFTSVDGVCHNDAAVLGAAGSGKTTAFTRRLPYGWAKGELFKDVELLFIIIVRTARETSLDTLLGLRTFGLRRSEREDVEEFLETNDDPKKVLIVVDGTWNVKGAFK